MKVAIGILLACETEVDDRTELRRSFPLDFIALPWDSDLSEKANGMPK